MWKSKLVPAIMLLIGATFLLVAFLADVEWWEGTILGVAGAILLIGGIAEGTD